MLAALVLVSCALIVTLGILFFGSRHTPPSAEVQKNLEAEGKARSAAQGELEKKCGEIEEYKGQLTQLKEQLKQAKRKLYEQKEVGREGGELAKARLEVERTASVQLESIRSELAVALVEIERLKSEPERGRRRVEQAPELAAKAEPAKREPIQKEARFRELSPTEKERLDRLEHQANRDRARAADFEHEVKRLKGRLETQHRIYVMTKGELDLVKDKFKALEKRLNRTLLERDLLKRAIADLERKTGGAAGRTELTAEEIAASDQQVEDEAARQASQQRTAQSANPEPPGV